VNLEAYFVRIQGVGGIQVAVLLEVVSQLLSGCLPETLDLAGIEGRNQAIGPSATEGRLEVGRGDRRC
jgi:hypothetical protein